MRQFRHCIITVFSLVVTASAVTAAGCSSNSYKAALDELERVVVSSASKVGNRTQWLQTGESAAAPAADDLNRALTKARAALGNDAASQPDAVAALQRGESLHRAIRDAMSSASTATGTQLSLASEARQAVPAHATVRSASDESTVAKLGGETLHDLVCSAAMDSVAPADKKDFADRPFTFSYLRDKTPEAAAKAVAGLAAGRVGAVFSKGFQWGRYGTELANDANRHVTFMKDRIESPDLTVTRSYIYVVRSCLKPPR
ncbi:hypothetical protein [Arthrobacter sp. UYEF3]|uniref:hypothetical protein n=1 Tax=Arthrobacter sp. UYEF3 TaxID=1756365 RepID=UPI00339A9600